MKRIEYDPEVDAAYFQIEDRPVVDSEEIADGIIVDYDEDDQVVAVELLGVKTIDPQTLSRLTPLLSPRAVESFRKKYLSLAVA